MDKDLKKLRDIKTPPEERRRLLEKMMPLLEQKKKASDAVLADRKAWDKLSAAKKMDFLYELMGGAEE